MRNLQSTLSWRWFQEVWNNAQRSSIEKYFASETVPNGLSTPDQPKGPEGFRLFYDDFLSRFSDVHIEVADVIQQDDMEASHCHVKARHIGTGKPIHFSGVSLIRVANDKIIEAWNYFNFQDIEKQLTENT